MISYFNWLKQWLPYFAVSALIVTAAIVSVATVNSKLDATANKLEWVIKGTDRNGRILECVLEALGTGESLKRSEVKECQKKESDQERERLRNQSFPVASPTAALFAELPQDTAAAKPPGSSSTGNGDAPNPSDVRLCPLGIGCVQTEVELNLLP